MSTAVRPVHSLGNISQYRELSLERRQVFCEWSRGLNRPALVMQENAYTHTFGHVMTTGGAALFSSLSHCETMRSYAPYKPSSLAHHYSVLRRYSEQ